MALRIVIDSQATNGVYYPGQIISGKVVASLAKQQPVALASIEFRGKIDTEYVEGRHGPAGNTHGPRRRAHETIRLFAYNQELFRGPYDLPPKVYEWPFTFTIPTQCDHTRVKNTAPGFVPDGPSELPPSFQWEDHTISHDARARVKYKLVASIQSGGIFKNKDIESVITIARLAKEPPPKQVIVRREFLPSICWESSSLRQQGLSFKEKLKALTSDDPALKTPCIAFRAFVHIPEFITLTDPLPISFSIQHRRISQNDPETPELILQEVKLFLKSLHTMTAAKTGISLGGDRFCSNDVVDGEKRLRFDPLVLPLNGNWVHTTDDAKVQEWVRKSLQGDFMTYTIHCAHKLRIEAEIRHRASGHSFHVRSEFPLKVLDAYVDRPAPYEQAAGVSRLVEEDPELPSYNDHAHDRPPEHEDAKIVVKS